MSEAVAGPFAGFSRYAAELAAMVGRASYRLPDALSVP